MHNAVAGRGPAFIAIGLQKAGTRWLYNQLQTHPDFWMPAVKELHFFDRPFPHPGMLKKIEGRAYPGQAEFQKLIAGLPRSREPDFEVYASLFSFAGDKLTGDITPAYSRLDSGLIGRLSERFPEVKILIMLRDPISRLWSNVNDAAARGKLPDKVVTDVDELQRVLSLDTFGGLSYPEKIYRRWAQHFAPERLRYFFLDDVIRDPQATRAAILRYLGADPELESGLSLSHNPKDGRPRAPLEGAVRDYLILEFEPELRACASTFGGAAVGWLAKYGLADTTP